MLPELLRLEIRHLTECGYSHPLLIVDKFGLDIFTQIARDKHVPLARVLCEVDTIVDDKESGERTKSKAKWNVR